MKQSKAVVEKRREKILEMVQKTGDIKVSEIAQYLHVSLLTIRRDLQYLEDQKLLERYYGGARVENGNEHNEKQTVVESARDEIARYAATLVEDGDTIFINTSKTALDMVPYITARNVMVVTNNGNAINLKHSSRISICLTGGELRYIKGAMVGDMALSNLMKVTAKKSFIGCSGLSLESGMTTEFLNEVQINETMILKVIGNAYILADYTKLGKNSSFVSCPTEKITHIITDINASEEVVSGFLDMGIDVKQVGKRRVYEDRENQGT